MITFLHLDVVGSHCSDAELTEAAFDCVRDVDQFWQLALHRHHDERCSRAVPCGRGETSPGNSNTTFPDSCANKLDDRMHPSCPLLEASPASLGDTASSSD